MTRPAIFLDRDGVLNRNLASHVKRWEDFHFLPGVLDALRMLASLPLPIVVVTNQAVINRGQAPHHIVDAIHQRMRRQIEEAGGRIDGIYACPHTPDERCACRKPEPGLLFQAARELDIDLTRSVFVGDALTDVRAGKRAGCHTILVLTGRGRPALAQLNGDAAAWPNEIVADLFRATSPILQLIAATKDIDPISMMAGQELPNEGFEDLRLATDFALAAFDH